MSVTKISDCEHLKDRVILATVDGDSGAAQNRESQLKPSIWRDVQTCQFKNTQDSAWSILGNILRIDSIKLQYIQDELDSICTTLPTQFAPRPNWSFFRRLFGPILPRWFALDSKWLYLLYLFENYKHGTWIIPVSRPRYHADIDHSPSLKVTILNPHGTSTVNSKLIASTIVRVVPSCDFTTHARGRKKYESFMSETTLRILLKTKKKEIYCSGHRYSELHILLINYTSKSIYIFPTF